MTNLSKAAAIKASAGTASIFGSGTSWQIYGPYTVTEPNGPSTSNNADSYDKARRIATQWRAEVALAMMGCWSHDVQIAVDHHSQNPWTPKTIGAYIDAGVAAFGRDA
jgi:hypothetical protein